MEIDIDNNLDEINVHVIEEKAFEATIKPPDASAMKTALDRDGHIALHVNFDFNKATLRPDAAPVIAQVRSEEHTSELQSLMRISYAVFCLKKKKTTNHNITNTYHNHS